MASVPFCNLSDVYSDWKDNTNKYNTRIKRSVETQYFPEDVHKEKSVPVGAGPAPRPIVQEKKEQNSSQDLINPYKDPIVQKLQMQLPTLNTFKNAESCNARNNAFQNDAANNTLRTSGNPLNDPYVFQEIPYYVSNHSPYGSAAPIGPSGIYSQGRIYDSQGRIADSSLMKQSYPYNNYWMYPNNTLPVNQMQNVWPRQMWYTSEPQYFETSDPFNSHFNYYGPQRNITEHFGNGTEHFGNGTEYFTNDYNSRKMFLANVFNMLIAILCFLFFMQLIDLFTSFQLQVPTTVDR